MAWPTLGSRTAKEQNSATTNKTLSVECYSEISVNCVFMFCCYFDSVVYCSLDVFYIINFVFFLQFIPCCMCVCHMCIHRVK